MSADLIERLRGPVRKAASRLIAGSFRRDGERLSEKRPRFSIPARPEEDDDLILIAAIEEAAAALEAEASGGECWQPIETAPKDGTRVIIAVPANDPSGFVVGEAYCNEKRGGWWWANLSDDDYYADPIRDTPTHWRQIPPPPQDHREAE